MKSNFPKIPLFLSIVFLIFSYSALVFLYKEKNNNSRNERQAVANWQAEANKRNQMRSLDHSMKAISSERTALETHFAQSSDIVPFLDTIERSAPEVRAKTEVTSVDIPEDNSGLSVGLKVTGSFESLYKFLTLLENSPYEIEFLSMDIEKKEQSLPGKNIKIYQWEGSFKIRLLSFFNNQK